MYIESLRKTGQKHILMFQPCQDYSKSELFNGHAIASVADGHGNQRYYLSETGSRLACESALDVLRSVVPSSVKDAVHRRRLANNITERWREKVLADFSKRCNPHISPAAEDHVYSIYGTTLIWAVGDTDDVIIGQIGDGAAVAVRNDGSILLPFGEPVCSDTADSLCCGNASGLFKTAAMPAADLNCVILCTDGLVNYFSGIDEFYYCIQGLARSPEPALPDTGDDSAAAILYYQTKERI